MIFAAAGENIVEEQIQKVQTVSEFMAEKLASLIQYITKNRADILWDIMIVILIFFSAKVVLKIVSSITSAAIKRKVRKGDEVGTKRARTVLSLFRSFMRYFIYVVAVLGSLVYLGVFNVGTALTGAGLGAVVIGFGAQSVVQDVFTGLFLIFENQFSVGDHIKVDEAEGIVEASALRVTYINTLKGERIIVPNGTISRVINYSSGGYTAVVDIAIAYEANARAVMQVIHSAVQIYAKDYKDLILEDPEVLGINEFKDSSMIIRVVCKTKALHQWDVERGLRLAVKEAFDSAGVPFPYPKYRIDVKSSDGAENAEQFGVENTGNNQNQQMQSRRANPVPIWQQHNKTDHDR